jgi:hypothetical protein
LSGLANVSYGVATIRGLFKITGLFCKRALLKRRYSAKETYDSLANVSYECLASHVADDTQRHSQDETSLTNVSRDIQDEERHRTTFARRDMSRKTFLDGYCSTVQGLLDWLDR